MEGYRHQGVLIPLLNLVGMKGSTSLYKGRQGLFWVFVCMCMWEHTLSVNVHHSESYYKKFS